MPFNEMKGEELGSSGIATVYSGFPQNFYEVAEIPFEGEEKKFAKLLKEMIVKKASYSELEKFEGIHEGFASEFREKIVSVVELNSLLEKIPSSAIMNSLFYSLEKMVEGIGFIRNKTLFANYVLQNSVGLKSLSFFSLDPELEELMVNRMDSIFVFHKEHGVCKTNVSLSEKEFESTLQRIALSSGKSFGNGTYLLDARLPDGSRVNVASHEVSPKGTTLTIRKFSPTPVTVLDLIEDGTLTSDLAAFFWVMVDGFRISPANILICGGTATGKTTILNVLANFIRLNKRVVSIEDTQEISLLGRQNWVPLEARCTSGDEVRMDDLLKNSLRMRPDRIIVGEVRGSEAQTLFNAMDTGHEGCLSTLHANNAREAILRLQERPMNVPQSMLPLLDLIVVMKKRNNERGKVFRQVSQVSELSRMEKKVLLANVYEEDKEMGGVRRSDLPSHYIEVLAEKSGMTKNEVKHEIDVRKGILDWMISKGIRKPIEVLELIQDYYRTPEEVLKLASGEE